MSKKNIISILLFFYCLFLPYEEVIITPVGSLLKIIGLMIMLVVILFTRRFIIKKNWISLIIWLVFNLISVTWSTSFDWWSYFFRIYVSQIAFVFLVAHIPLEWIDQDMVKKGFVLGASIASSILIFFPNTSTYTSEGRRTLIIMDANMDPNILATIILMAIFILLTMNISKIWYLITILLVAGIFFTGSRGVTIAMVCSFTMLVLSGLKNRRRRGASFAILFVALIAIWIIWNTMPSDLLSSRFSIKTILGLNEFNVGVHNRYTIWIHSWDLFWDRPLLGYGCGNFFSAIASVYRECAAHNLIVLELIELGIIGSLPLFYFLYKIMKELYSSKQWYVFYMLLSVYIVALTLDTLMYKYFWFAIIFSNWASRMQRKNNDTVY